MDETIAATQRAGAKLIELEAQLVRADILVRTEGARASVAVEFGIGRAEALAQEMGARIHLPHVPLARAELAGVQGDEGRRRTLRRAAHRLCVEMGATGHAERLAKELGSS